MLKNFFRGIKIKLYCLYNEYILKNIIKLDIKSIDESLDYVIDNNISVSRFGDGELAIINGVSINFQDKNDSLQQRLKEILKSSNNNIAICVPEYISKIENLEKSAEEFWENHLKWHRSIWYRNMNLKRTYYNTQMTRLYIDYLDKSKCSLWFKTIKKIWEHREVVIIEGEFSKLGIGNDLFDNAKSIQRILAPSKNAYDKYNELLEEASKIDKSKLILIALGPTATVLAHDLAIKGYQAIDIGHIDIEYEWFLNKSKDKIAIDGKYTNEAINNNDSVFNFNSNDYNNEIISRIV